LRSRHFVFTAALAALGKAAFDATARTTSSMPDHDMEVMRQGIQA
jgi:hypothetical protein